MDILYIKILDEFDIDLCVTFLNFQTSSRLYKDVFHIAFLEQFDVEL